MSYAIIANRGAIPRAVLCLGISVFLAGAPRAQETSPLADKIVHVYNPFGNALPLINLSGVGNAMEAEGGNWYRFAFASLGGGLAPWMVDFGIRTGDWRWLNPNGLGTQGVFDMTTFAAAKEVWIIVDPADTASRPHILTQPPPMVHLFNPWPVSAPQIVLGGVRRSMLADKDHCGWYGAFILPPGGTAGFFRNIADGETWGRGGLGDSATFDFGGLFTSVGRDLWIASPTQITATHTGLVGSCTYLMGVTVHDMSRSHPDFGNNVGNPMVQSTLGPDRKPAPTSLAPPNFSTWFNADPGKAPPLKGAQTCLDLEMSRADDGLWEYDDEKNNPATGGFFPIDDWNTLDDNVACAPSAPHNYGFCLESHATFVYQKGQVFDFRGDDDVWVFIDGKLALDLGGIHPPMAGRILLDTLGLVEGRTYPWDFFFCERNMCGSSLRIKTTIYFRQQRAFGHEEDTLPDGSRNIRVIKRVGGTGACGSAGDSLREVPPGPLTFVLYRANGDSLQVLPRGIAFGGIEVGEASVKVDTSKVIGLPAGEYRIVFYETSAPRVRDEIRFTVAARNAVEFDPPHVVTATLGEVVRVVAANRFGDSLVAGAAPWTPVFTSGLAVHGDSGRSQPVRSGVAISTAPTGLDTLWVTGDPAAQADRTDTLSIPGSVKRVVVTFRLPPLDLPLAAAAAIYDDDGDGRGDRLEVRYDRDIAGRLPKEAAWRWPSDAPPVSGTDLPARLEAGTSLVFRGTQLSAGILTQGTGTFLSTYPASAGRDSVQAIPIVERIGPVITLASMRLGAASDTLRLVFSEPLSAASRGVPALDLFGYRLGGAETPVALTPTEARWATDGTSLDLIFPASAATPAPKAGDFVRLNDGPGLAADPAGNRPGPQTRFRVITGDPRIGIRTVTYREIAPDAALLAGPVFLPSLQPRGTRVEAAVERTGRMGHLLELDLADFAVGDGFTGPPPEQVILEYTVALFTNHGVPVAREKGTLPCTHEIFQGDCRIRRGPVFIGWNQASADGRKAGTGAYVATFRMQVRVRGEVAASGQLDQIWGLLRRN